MHSWPYHAEDEMTAVMQVLASGKTNYWTGNECREFEKEYAAYIDVPYAVAVMNGTVALEAALYAFGIGPGDEVITSCRTFIASASCIVMRGATPVIADVDLISQNITVDTIKPCITPRTKAIIVVHLAGWPADMEAIMALAAKHGLKVIEDCAQAHGAAWNNRKVGAWGDIGAFSFCQDKIITTGGEGGMITTKDKQLWEKLWSFKDHGKNYEKIYFQDHPPGFRWLHDSFGTNWRMTEMQAAIGRIQLKKLTDWLLIRKRHAAKLNDAFKQLPALLVTLPPPQAEHVYYKYYVFIQPEHLKQGWDRDKIMQALNATGIACYTGSCSEIDLEKAFDTIEWLPRLKPNAKKLGETSLMFLVHPTLTDKDTQTTIQAVRAVMAEAMCETMYLTEKEVQ